MSLGIDWYDILTRTRRERALPCRLLRELAFAAEMMRCLAVSHWLDPHSHTCLDTWWNLFRGVLFWVAQGPEPISGTGKKVQCQAGIASCLVDGGFEAGRR